jgi:cystathionine gamma-synthase
MKGTLGLNTECVHAALEPDAATGALAQPIHLSTTFERDADGGYARGYRYSRESTPNRVALEACLTRLEHGIGAVAFASGLAANMAVWQLLQPGDRVIAPLVAYHGTLRQLREYVEPRGIEVSAVDLCDVAAVQAALGAGARMVWTETPANPLLSITDLAAVSALARRAGAWVVCDNTFATPVCQQPFDFGVDLVVHSATKYFGGHSDVMGGVVLVRQDTSLLERIRGWQVLAGGVLGPFDCWLLRRSLATLALRVRAQCASALSVAGFLESHRAVERVHYPGLPTHPNHALAARQMPGGFGAMLSLCVRGGQEAAIAAAARTRLLRRATSLGGVESLIEHRASIEGPGSTTPENLLRVSVGIEDAADLIEDLSQALS